MRTLIRMLSFTKLKRVGLCVICGCCISYLVMFIALERQTSLRHRLKPRHRTERTIRGPEFHIHKIDPMKIELREHYESRRLLVEQARPKLTSRTEILTDYRMPADTLPALPTETSSSEDRFVSLRDDGAKMSLKCDTCALVSNSGHMIYSRLGDQIDSAQCVFRLNAAPTLAHELDVGRKTTVRVLSHRSVAALVANSTTLLKNNPYIESLIIHGFDYQFMTGSIPRLLDKVAEKYPKVELYRVGKPLTVEAERDFRIYTGKSRISSGSELSTGLYALLIMKDVCSSIKVYGMIPEGYCRDNADNLVPYSYYKDPSLSECLLYNYHETIAMGGQRLSTERRIFKAWAKQRNIVFLHPEWA